MDPGKGRKTLLRHAVADAVSRIHQGDTHRDTEGLASFLDGAGRAVR